MRHCLREGADLLAGALKHPPRRVSRAALGDAVNKRVPQAGPFSRRSTDAGRQWPSHESGSLGRSLLPAPAGASLRAASCPASLPNRVQLVGQPQCLYLFVQTNHQCIRLASVGSMHFVFLSYVLVLCDFHVLVLANFDAQDACKDALSLVSLSYFMAGPELGCLIRPGL